MQTKLKNRYLKPSFVFLVNKDLVWELDEGKNFNYAKAYQKKAGISHR